MNNFFIVGAGPGDPSFLLPRALTVISTADILIGPSRIVEQYAEKGKEILYSDGRISDVADMVRSSRDRGTVAVLVAGDPCWYSLGKSLMKSFSSGEYEVVPGLSSMQLAFCRIGASWSDAELMSLHGRTAVEFDEVLSSEHLKPYLVCLTDARFSPSWIAGHVLDTLNPPKRIWVAERLSYPDERVKAYEPAVAASITFDPLSLVVLEW